jgi:hypothetical protein
MYIHAYGHQPAGDLGWFIDTRIRTAKTPAGHEIVTERAARGMITNRADLAALIAGVRRPDLADPQDHIKLGEEKRHFLRSITYSPLHAWFYAIDHLQKLHQQMIASSNRADQFMLIGEALHLIQDSFAPAHVERDSRTGDILNIRVYGPKAPPGNHLFHVDPGDDISTTKPPRALTLSAQKAITCSKEYLRMALRHIQLKQLPPQLTSLPQQTARDLKTFISRRLWLRLPDLSVGSSGEAVGILIAYLNGWMLQNAPGLLSSLPLPKGSNPTFDSNTHDAVLHFQKAKGLNDNGIVKRPTWEKLLLFL